MAEPATVFVVNPRSAAGATLRRFERLRPQIRRHLGEFDVKLTTRPMHAAALTAEAIDEGAKVVVAVGGDGTANEVLNGFFDGDAPRDPDVAMGVMVSGTGGDFRRTFGWSDAAEDAIERLRVGRRQAIDVGRVTFTDHQGDTVTRHFLNIASFGLSGAVDEVVNNTPKTFGATLSFLAGTLRAFASYRSQPVTLTLDDAAARDETVQMVAMCNGQYFGGGMWIAPDADPFDGKLTYVGIGDVSKSFWLKNAAKVYSGRHTKLDGITVAEGSKLVAAPRGDLPVLLDIDGEQPGRLPATFEIVPGALPFVT